MPQLGTGIIPAQGAIAAELTSIVRRAFMPRVYVQLWKAAPLMACLMSAAQVASGGLSPITTPVQGAPMVSGQWVDYSGSFDQPGVMPGIQNAEFNLKAFCTPRAVAVSFRACVAGAPAPMIAGQRRFR